ncbi:hypothetical protein LUZ62_067272 [Rhynchospora pubera]|uniref:Hypervirulence associated protein TUDOR domain-containing protein n=1 Tax=Rhynchospora pubera TaxID=906938 RepID=A0AAV8EU51_9POAL|nr:hypothetical protein LUZ62_067272 [Rhynchospora pubera]
MATNEETPSWAETWGQGGMGDRSAQTADTTHEDKKKSNSNGTLANVKSVAYTGLTKAKVVVVLGAQKVKNGTVTGIKWVKEKYQKKGSAHADPK